MRRVKIGNVEVSGLCIGGNPFSGFSHQTPERNTEMVDWYTPERIWETLRLAEAAGVNTFFGRTDDHILGIVEEYWMHGGTIQWFAQVCCSADDPDGWRSWLQRSVELGCCAAYLHGGVVDYWHCNDQHEHLAAYAAAAREAGVAVGFAGHQADAHAWIRDHLDVDFQMCCHYNPTDRSQRPEHQSEGEKWDESDRAAMLEVIATIESPVVHYKIFAGGNRPIVPAFEVLGSAMRPRDVACVGIFTKDDADMIAQDVALFEEYVDGAGTAR